MEHQDCSPHSLLGVPHPGIPGNPSDNLHVFPIHNFIIKELELNDPRDLIPNAESRVFRMGDTVYYATVPPHSRDTVQRFLPHRPHGHGTTGEDRHPHCPEVYPGTSLKFHFTAKTLSPRHACKEQFGSGIIKRFSRIVERFPFQADLLM